MGSPSSPEKSPERMDPSSAMASESLPTNPFALIDHLQSEIGAMDIAKDVVTSKLAEEIQRNYHTFIQGPLHDPSIPMIRHIEVDLDLAQALIQVKNGRRLLAIHKKDLVMSHLELVKLRRNRDRVHTVRLPHSHEQDMVAALHDKAFERAVRVCAALRHRATHLHQFSVLKQSIQRMHLALPELRQHFHSALGDLLVSFDGDVYDELLRALAALDAHLSSSSPSKGTPPSARSPTRAVVGTDDVVRVVVAAMDELTRGAVANLLDTTSTGASIAMVVDAVLNVYELLVSLLHNLDLFEQWHDKRGESDDAAAADAFRRLMRMMIDTEKWERLSVDTANNIWRLLESRSGVCGQYVKWVHEMAWVRTHLYAHLLAVFEFNLYTIFRRCCPDASISRLLARQTPTDLACHHLRDWVLVQNQQNHPPHHLPPDGPSDDDTLVRRILAVESVAFQWHVLSTIIAAHDQQRHDVLTLVVHEARAYVYAGLVPQAIQAAGIPRLIEHATWDVVGTRHNEYVVTLVRHCGSAVPVAVRDELWAVVVRAVMEALVDGYANVKKCSAEGRALMSMDLMALQNGLDLINHTVSEHRWGRAYVHNYIKAYYFQEPELLAFIDANKS
ncbi:hypothetical protein DYB38_007081 [Aphanomyces astaci]|uniref:Syndetin C-terminal domain-containing protein n=1 Tax=Aphanomyces astaci TaxID=112090 RepID=A0A397DMH9_APHAT|nr:hypothetical protein DYB38_007081 [Aphanomyces astaci]